MTLHRSVQWNTCACVYVSWLVWCCIALSTNTHTHTQKPSPLSERISVELYMNQTGTCAVPYCCWFFCRCFLFFSRALLLLPMLLLFVVCVHVCVCKPHRYILEKYAGHTNTLRKSNHKHFHSKCFRQLPSSFSSSLFRFHSQSLRLWCLGFGIAPFFTFSKPCWSSAFILKRRRKKPQQKNHRNQQKETTTAAAVTINGTWHIGTTTVEHCYTAPKIYSLSISRSLSLPIFLSAAFDVKIRVYRNIYKRIFHRQNGTSQSILYNVYTVHTAHLHLHEISIYRERMSSNCLEYIHTMHGDIIGKKTHPLKR